MQQTIAKLEVNLGNHEVRAGVAGDTSIPRLMAPPMDLSPTGATVTRTHCSGLSLSSRLCARLCSRQLKGLANGWLTAAVAGNVVLHLHTSHLIPSDLIRDSRLLRPTWPCHGPACAIPDPRAGLPVWARHGARAMRPLRPEPTGLQLRSRVLWLRKQSAAR
jgi:hypothetical protein